MTINSVSTMSGYLNESGRLDMKLTHPKHLAADVYGHAFTQSGGFIGPVGEGVLNLEKITGAGAVTRAGTFEEAMLQALDKVSAADQFAGSLAQKAITEPGSIDIHDVTIAEAKASMSLDITRNILSRLVQGWRDIINTR
ncbi:MAG: flagellar hook-basal body complex protein FliE [Treponema sp.]|nr:flagellar hook-basal body complex protein FliE [Treponema sp.]